MKAPFIIATTAAIGIAVFGGIQYSKAEEQPQPKTTAVVPTTEQAKQIKGEQKTIETLKANWMKANDEYEYKVAAATFLKQANRYTFGAKYDTLVDTGKTFENFTKTQEEVVKMNDDSYLPYHNEMQRKREAFQYAIWDAEAAFYQSQGFYTTYVKDFSRNVPKEVVAQNKEKFIVLQQTADKLYATIGTNSAINKDKAYQQTLKAYQKAFVDLFGEPNQK